MDARQPHSEVVAEAVHRVVGTGRGDSLDRQPCPLRMLRRKQRAHEVRVGVDLVDVHFFHTRYLTDLLGFIGSLVAGMLGSESDYPFARVHRHVGSTSWVVNPTTASRGATF